MLHQQILLISQCFYHQQIMLICYFYFLSVIFMTTTTARQIHIVVRDNVTQACPGRKLAFFDIIKVAKFLLRYHQHN